MKQIRLKEIRTKLKAVKIPVNSIIFAKGDNS